ELARTLDSAGVEIVSTGSTAAKIADLGINVTPVESLTGFPECLEGRVKTLHPRVHAGILADTRKPDHLNQLEELEIEPFQLVVVVVGPACSGDIAEAVAQGGFDLAQRRQLAATAFKHTADYDVAVSGWFAQQLADDSVASAELEGDALRYGETPHQQASIVREGTTGVANAKQLHGKEMSYNNYQDADAAWRAAWDHERPCVAIIKH